MLNISFTQDSVWMLERLSSFSMYSSSALIFFSTEVFSFWLISVLNIFLAPKYLSLGYRICLLMFFLNTELISNWCIFVLINFRAEYFPCTIISHSRLSDSAWVIFHIYFSSAWNFFSTEVFWLWLISVLNIFQAP